MIEKNYGLVLKGMAAKFTVLFDGNVVMAKSRGKLKRDTKILPGDYVKLQQDEYSAGEFVITDIAPRKNMITRPKIANLDQLIIVIGYTPAPDLMLVDKLLINCVILGIEPVIAINKADIASKTFIEEITSQYKEIADIVLCSAVSGEGIDELKGKMREKVTAFAGQSAVGKSSILNKIGGLQLSTNTLSAKIDRGRHTTRESQIFVIEDMFIADTPGFSMLELRDINPAELERYYADFNGFREGCRYLNCSHKNTKAKECGVVAGVESEKINSERYKRYLQLYEEVKKQYDNKYN